LGTLYLSRPAKPRNAGKWTIEAHSRAQFSGEFPSDPTMTLRWKDPGLSGGSMIEIDLVAISRVLGRLRRLSHTILASVDSGNHTITQYSL
jgi:hypothetical protein